MCMYGNFTARLVTVHLPLSGLNVWVSRCLVRTSATLVTSTAPWSPLTRSLAMSISWALLARLTSEPKLEVRWGGKPPSPPPPRGGKLANSACWKGVHGLKHKVGRVLSLFSSRRAWDSPNPLPAGECAPPFGTGGRGTLAGGGGRVPIPTRGHTLHIFQVLQNRLSWFPMDCSCGMKYTMNAFWQSYWCRSEFSTHAVATTASELWRSAGCSAYHPAGQVHLWYSVYICTLWSKVTIVSVQVRTSAFNITETMLLSLWCHMPHVQFQPPINSQQVSGLYFLYMNGT